jgi:TPR repeat protein
MNMIQNLDEQVSTTYFTEFTYNLLDNDKLFSVCEKHAKAGNPIAQYNLGFIYHKIRKDLKSAYEYYLESYNSYDVAAAVALGYMHMDVEAEDGKTDMGFKQDFIIAHQYFSEATEYGVSNPTGFIGLADLYLNSKAVAQLKSNNLLSEDFENDNNRILLFEVLYTSAVDLGSTNAMVKLGKFYESLCDKTNIKDNNDLMDKAINMFKMATELNDGSAMCNLARIYTYHKKPDHNKAFELLVNSANLGCKDAFFNLINLYRTTDDKSLRKNIVCSMLEFATIWEEAFNQCKIMYQSGSNIATSWSTDLTEVVISEVCSFAWYRIREGMCYADTNHITSNKNNNNKRKRLL